MCAAEQNWLFCLGFPYLNRTGFLFGFSIFKQNWVFGLGFPYLNRTGFLVWGFHI